MISQDYNWTAGGYAPKLTVYTSTDLLHWHDHGLVFPTQAASQWCPSVIFAKGRFIAWWAGFNSASSTDGAVSSYIILYNKSAHTCTYCADSNE